VRKSFLSKFTAALCLIAVITITFLPGCAKEKVVVPQSLDKLSLSSMWENVAKSTGVQDASAELESLLLHADKEGKVNSLSFIFHGRNQQGRPEVYFVGKNSKGELDQHAYGSQSVPMTRHPLKVFAEIDSLGLSSLEPGDAGLSVQVDFLSGDVGYSYEYSDIFHLEGGALEPLDRIVFHSRTPWCTIGVFKLSPPETIVTVDGRTVAQATTVAGPVPPGKRTSQIWFLSEDINKAETVEYLEK